MSNPSNRSCSRDAKALRSGARLPDALRFAKPSRRGYTVVLIGTHIIIGTFFSTASAAEPKIVGYFPEWSVFDRNYHVKDIPAEKLTHINYGFAKIVNGECALVDSFAAIEKEYPGDKPGKREFRGSFNQLRLLKKKHSHLKTLISVGGWTLSGPFSDAALTQESRAKFAKSCVAFIRKHQFDGVDVDWEYPVNGGLASNKGRKEDKRNFTLLLTELRRQLDDAGKADKATYLLTIAAPAGPGNIANIEIDKIHEHLDWINLMAYDFHGGWDAVTNFNAPLFSVKDDPARDEMSRKLNVDSAVRTYLDAKVPPEKLVLGVPFHGRGWSGVKNGNNGLFQAKTRIPKGKWEEGLFDYKELAERYIGKSTRYWNDEAKVPWLFDETTGLMISYDDPESLKWKVKYVREKKLGGIMIWELSADDAKSSLLDAIIGK